MTEVYFADVTPLCDGGRYERVAAMLSAERAGKAAACRLERDRQLSAGAGYLLSLALAEREIDEVSAEYAYGEYGRPYWIVHSDDPLVLILLTDKFYHRFVTIDTLFAFSIATSFYNEALHYYHIFIYFQGCDIFDFML